METTTKQSLKDIAKETSTMLEMFTPREIENILFDVFADAQISSDGLLEDVKQDRQSVHRYLRMLLFSLNNDKLVKLIKASAHEL